MIDANKFKKIYEKIQLQENHNLIVGKIAQLSGVDANTVQEVASKLGFTDLTHVTPEQFEQICCAAKDTQKLVTPDTQKKVPIKDEENLNEPTNLNEADPQEDTQNNEETTEEPIDESLLYDIIYAYYMATAKDNPKAKEFLTTLNSNPLMQRIEKKYATITQKSETMQKQDSTKASPNNLKSMLTMLFAAITKAKKESAATQKNP